MRSNVGRNRGGGGRGRGLRGDQSKGVFYKLLKDEKASLRSKDGVRRFIIGMESFAEKSELLGLLDDNRYQGLRRIREAVEEIENCFHVETILIPIISCIINNETNRPLYKRVRNRILAVIHGIPGLYDLLIEIGAVEYLSSRSSQVLCSYFEESAMALIDARNCEKIKTLAEALKAKGTDGALKLCSLLLISEDSAEANKRTKGNNRGDTACWVSDMSPPGGRHDNDFENYRDIQLVPTDDEIKCEARSWLPLASEENAFIENKQVRMLDRNFRLLREDAVSTMKTNIEQQKRVWKNARVIGWHFNEKNDKGRKILKPLTFLVQLDPLNVSKTMNWEKSRSLPHEGVIALVSDTEVRRLGTITIRNYKEKDKWLLHPDGPIIGVIFNGKDDLDSALDEALTNMAAVLREKASTKSKKKGKTEGTFISYSLVEASGSFFSYRPILSALQQLSSIPLAQDLVYIDPSGERPAYLPSKIRMPCNNSFNGFVCDIDLPSTDKIVAATSLDKSQAEAVVNVFTSRVALIQGPPGTGKTFIGALIAQMIRENTDETILCVCYTNHALDQFLECLRDQGESKIVRIGGRSKSAKLTPFNLRELARTKGQLPRAAERRIKSVYAKLHESHQKISDLVAQLKVPLSWDEPNGGASLILSKEYSEIYDAFTCMEDLAVDGFQIVASNNKSATSKSLFLEWMKGSKCPDWLSVYKDYQPELIDFWNTSVEQRIEMSSEWHSILVDDVKDSLREETAFFEELSAEKEAVGRERDLMILQDARVIGATTNGAAKYRDIISAKSPGVVIVEEAGEVLEPHIISALAERTDHSEETKHLILIGDHLQLRPKVESHKLTTVSGGGYNFDCSLFERLINAKYPSAMLKVQHRMRPYISAFIRRQTYPDLIDHSSVFEFENIKGVATSVAFIQHDQFEDQKVGAEESKTTKSNRWEAEMCVEIVRYLLLQGYAHSQITILTPYVGQVLQIINTMRAKMRNTTAYISDLDKEEILGNLGNNEDQIGLNEEVTKQSVRCSSIDNFQGEESDIIVVSLVRSNRIGNIGFLKEEQRVNVLLSRARFGMYIVGNSKTLEQSAKGACVWKPILRQLETDGNLMSGFPSICQLHPEDAAIQISDHNMFQQLCPNGGCIRPCNNRLTCGHACPMACHPTDRNHLIAHKKCVRRCRRIPPECKLNHTCPKLCNEDCGKCKAMVEPMALLCGHTIEKPYCYEVRNKIAIKEISKRCKVMVEYQFLCGHKCSTTCGNTQNDVPKCDAECGKKMGCGHICKKPCHEGDTNHACKTNCERQLLCGHICSKSCHASSPCPPCKNHCDNICIHSKCKRKCSNKCSSCVEPCDWKCQHQGACPLVCGAPCTRLPCNLRCTKILKCGHQCISVCGEICPSVDFCQKCCIEEKNEHVVDMITFTKYKDLDLDENPVIVLACGHFYTVETLDGIFDLTQAYEIDKAGKYIATKPLLRVDNMKPKCCPDCRQAVHSIARYGRLLSFSLLRFLERKHLMAVEKSLKLCAYKLSNDNPDLRKISDSLDRILIDIKNGPTKKVYEACGGDSQMEVPRPPSNPIIQAHQLMGDCKRLSIAKVNDGSYQSSISSYTKAILLSDETKSFRKGCETRISLAKLILNWNDVERVKEEITNLLEPALTNDFGSRFQKLHDAAKKLQQEVQCGSISQVIRAMNVHDGYNYGGAWSDHWYECPNGHPYFIGNCGGATTTAKCIECGEAVGGSGHRLLESNRQARGVVLAEAQKK